MRRRAWSGAIGTSAAVYAAATAAYGAQLLGLGLEGNTWLVGCWYAAGLILASILAAASARIRRLDGYGWGFCLLSAALVVCSGLVPVGIQPGGITVLVLPPLAALVIWFDLSEFISRPSRETLRLWFVAWVTAGALQFTCDTFLAGAGSRNAILMVVGQRWTTGLCLMFLALANVWLAAAACFPGKSGHAVVRATNAIPPGTVAWSW